MRSTAETATAAALAGKKIAFVGKLGSFNKRDAADLIRKHGGLPVDSPDVAELVVVGAEQLPMQTDDELLDEPLRRAAEEGRIEIITETELWERIGLLDEDPRARRLYTPAMLADLLGLSIATVRRWHRRGLIIPAKEVHRLPYFDFQEVATARNLANMLAAGISPKAIEKKLSALSQYVTGVDRPLAQLSVIIEGRQILLRQQEGLIEPSGQFRFDFESLEQTSEIAQDAQPPAVISIATISSDSADAPSVEHLLRAAADLEDRGQLSQAVELYRSALAAGGPQAQICFQVAELLYRLGDVTAARERYFMTLELDGRFVEARSNLGCVLAELGEAEMAVAAFQGALSLHPDYPDAHYQLARLFGELGQTNDAEKHWREFLRLAPESPWADEARQYLQ